MYRIVDLGSWDRRSTFEFFKDFADPFFNITAELDVTNLYRICKARGYRFSLACVYAALAGANEIREFRLRMIDDAIVEFDRVEATQTILNPDNTFSFSYYKWFEDFDEFMIKAAEAHDHYAKLRTFDVEADRIDLIYFSALPWMSFTSFKHASRLDNTRTVPRMVFGKWFEAAERKKIPFSVEVHHALMDGYHVGMLYEKAQIVIDRLAA